MTEDMGQNYLILIMETIRIYLFIQIAYLGVCVGGGAALPSPRSNFISNILLPVNQRCANLAHETH